MYILRASAASQVFNTKPLDCLYSPLSLAPPLCAVLRVEGDHKWHSGTVFFIIIISEKKQGQKLKKKLIFSKSIIPKELTRTQKVIYAFAYRMKNISYEWAHAHDACFIQLEKKKIRWKEM